MTIEEALAYDLPPEVLRNCAQHTIAKLQVAYCLERTKREKAEAEISKRYPDEGSKQFVSQAMAAISDRLVRLQDELEKSKWDADRAKERAAYAESERDYWWQAWLDKKKKIAVAGESKTT